LAFFVSLFAAAVLVRSDRLETEGIMTCGDHRERHRRAIRFGMHMLGLEPGAQPGVVDFRLALPKIRLQSALDVEVIELEFDGRNVILKIAPHIGFANVKPGNTAGFGMRFYNHRYLLFNFGQH